MNQENLKIARKITYQYYKNQKIHVKQSGKLNIFTKFIYLMLVIN